MMIGLEPKIQQAVAPNPKAGKAAATRTLQLILPGILLLAVCAGPYLNKAFTIDDPWFLLEAKQVLKTPLEPMSFSICWMDDQICLPRASLLGAGARQGLMGYLLTPVILGGGAEWIAHLIQMLVAGLCVVSMVRFALRLGFDRTQASIAGLMLVAIPPFLAMTSTAMPDIVALALALTGIERLLAWKTERRLWQGVAAALLLGVAPYARPHTAFLLALGALFLFSELRVQTAIRQLREDALLWAPIAGGAATLIAVNYLTRDRGLGTSADVLINVQNIPLNFAAYATYLVFPIPFALVWLGVKWRKKAALLLLPAVPGIVLHYQTSGARSLVEDWNLFAILYGVTAIAIFVYEQVKSGGRLARLLCMWVLLPLPAVAYAHFPIKYMVVIMPAVILLLVQALWQLDTRYALTICSAVIVALTLYSSLLLKADDDFAEYGRRAAAELIAPHVAAGEKVWYGGQWGFYWYAAEAGGVIFNAAESKWKPGDLLAVGLAESGGVTRDRFPNRVLVESRHYDTPHGRTMGYGGGLYSNRCGKSLWVWKPETTNDYELWRVY